MTKAAPLISEGYWSRPLFATEQRFAISGGLIPSCGHQFQCPLIVWLRQHRCEPPVIAGELSVRYNPEHACLHRTHPDIFPQNLTWISTKDL